MKYLQKHWQSRTTIVLITSIIIGILLATLDLTTWAEQINQQGYSHGAGEEGARKIPAIMRYILPFVKEFILIGVPLLITLGWLKISKIVKGLFKTK